jgi:acyl-CoA thioesterase-1
MIRRLLSLVLLTWLFYALGGCGHPRFEALPAGATVLVFGDSLTFGTGAESGEDYPSVLAAATHWNVINAGVPGDTTANGLERLPETLEADAPKLVLVELGGNDFLQHLPASETEDHLRHILASLKARGIPAVLVAIPRPSVGGAVFGHLTDDPVYQQLGQETGTPVIADVMAAVLSKGTLKSDQVHPNAAGYRAIAEGLQHALKDLGYLR